MSRGLAALVLSASALAAPAFAGWATLGAFPPPERSGQSLLFRNEQAVASVTVLAPDIVRVRVSPTRSFGRDHSYAVVSRDFGDPGASFEIGRGQSTVVTRALRVSVSHAPFRVAFASASGEVLDEDDKDLGTAMAGARIKVWKRLRDDEHVYGFGEKVGKLDKRGWQLGGYTYTMWNSDTYGYDSSTDPIYASVPSSWCCAADAPTASSSTTPSAAPSTWGTSRRGSWRSGPRAASSTTTSSTGPRRSA